MTKPTAAANATGLPEVPLSECLDEARYLVGLTADLCSGLAMACNTLEEAQRRGLLSINREITIRLDAIYAGLDAAHAKAAASEVHS